jgi:DNA (cytosine-5)-methyltransferase 1
MIAARTGESLPAALAAPTHYSPARRNLQVDLHNGHTYTTRVPKGCAPFPPVSIEDAISDLPRFDWAAPGKEPPRGRSAQSREVAVHREADSWGPDLGRNSNNWYSTPPRTSYQTWARARGNGSSLQHVTRKFDPKVVERRVPSGILYLLSRLTCL